MKFSVQVAESKLSELFDAALAGEELVIDRAGQVLVKLVTVAHRQFKIGVLPDQPGHGPDFFEPMSEDELAHWEGAA